MPWTDEDRAKAMAPTLASARLKLLIEECALAENLSDGWERRVARRLAMTHEALLRVYAGGGIKNASIEKVIACTGISRRFFFFDDVDTGLARSWANSSATAPLKSPGRKPARKRAAQKAPAASRTMAPPSVRDAREFAAMRALGECTKDEVASVVAWARQKWALS